MNDCYKLLYVEDDETQQESFAYVLKRYISDVTTAEDGEKALELFKKQRFDVVVLDIVLPHIDGLSVAKRIRELDTDTEIIITSAYSDNEKLLKALELQIFAYLIKPIKFEEVDATFKKLTAKLDQNAETILRDSYHWDSKIKKLYYRDEEIKISKNEKKLIVLLSSNKGKYYTACEIASEILDDMKDDDTQCNNIVQLISRFKKKMGILYSDERFFIENIYGLGYKIGKIF